MSLKNLFNSPNLNSVTSASLQDVIDDTESLAYIESYIKEQNKFVSDLDFSSAENFVRFGSAEKYFIDSIERIYKTYPYDGSRKEKVDFFLNSSDLDNYIFENEYPRTNGYANFIYGAPTTGEEGSYFYPSTTDEYILVKGGPNTSQRAKDAEISDTSSDYKSGYANKYNFSKNRENNLKIGGIDGNTVEFWLKKEAYVANQEYFEFIVDAHVTGATDTDDSYGRLIVALATTGTTANAFNQPIHISYASGSSNIRTYIGSSTLTTASIADGNWHHYAIRMKNDGSDTVFDLFVDGEYNDTTTETGTTVGYVSGAIVATVGSQGAIYNDGRGRYGNRGWCPLSASIDEFRYWKVWRNSQEIGRQYIEPIGAGTNTDDANTHLGVYFKFNEGITQTASIDSTVLDYSGRISNGAWIGYSSAYSRNTGSAMVESGKVSFEYKDPILYSFHPDVVALIEDKRVQGQEFDYRNPNSIYKSIPSWITDQEYGKQNPALENLTQIISSYFDTLHAQIENLSSLKHVSYVSGTADKNQKPFFFNNRILQSYGFPYIPDLFKDATFLEYFRNRDDKLLFEEKLYDVKNTIYSNIYNNLAYINKSKGTEKAFRNFFRCFGLDEEVLKLRVYSNNAEYEYIDNISSVSENKKYVNFSLTGSSESTVYQYKTGDNSTSFISGSDDTSSGIESTGHGFTVECQVVFPLVPSQAEYNILISNKNYSGGKLINAFVLDKETSIYGLRTAGTTENDTTVPTNDRAGFVVKSIRDNEFDQRCKFKLEPTTNSYFPTLETPYFEDVFDETKWNFAVSVKPTKYGQANFVSGSEDNDTYDVVFMGTRNILGETLENFEVSSTISNAYGKTILTKPKRLFIGAQRENVSGSLETRAFSSVTDCRFWLKPLTMSEIKKHNTDIYNYGIDNPYDSAYLFQDDLTDVRVSNIETLALNWNFLNLTSSDASGQFSVDDFSSGSSDDNRYGSLSGILSKQHTGRGDYFEPSYADAFAKKNVFNAKTNLPGYINSGDMISISNFDDMTFTRETRPVSYFMTIEKSMYQTISEDMIKIFSTMVDYGSLVGKQYSKYRIDNKDLKHLRQLFFEKISNTPKLEKYIDYYKWFDTSLNLLVENLVPLSAMRNETNSIIRPVIEEHVFNREKYISKFPSLKDKKLEPAGAATGGRETGYNYEFGSPPVSKTVDNSGLWYKERAERNDPAISSGDAGVDDDREALKNVISGQTDGDRPILQGSTYEGNTFAIRSLSRPYKISTDLPNTFGGGSNTKFNKKIGFWDAIKTRPTPSGSTEGALLSVEGADSIRDFINNNDNIALNKGKRSYSFTVGVSIDGQEEFSESYKGGLVFPFSFYSSSLNNNPSMGNLSDYKSNLAITNLHHDNYGPYNDVPMQGPFTEKYVGGRPYRHVMTNFTPVNNPPDAEGERLEGWRISASSDSVDLLNPNSPKSVYFREEYAKRPVNIKNIKQLTSSADTGDQATDASDVTKIGNYTENYEVVMTNGRSINNRYMVESEGDLATTTTNSTFISGVVDFAIPRRDLTGSGKSVIVNRFSAPGDPSTMAEGMLDVAAGEYSVYNALPFRNLDVRLPLQELYSDHANQFGYFSDQFTISAYELAGVAYPGGSSSATPEDYSGTGSFHKVNRNGRQAIRFSGSTGYSDDSYVETVKYDNFHVQHQIPQTDVQYAWITASLVEDYSGSALYGFEQPDFSNASMASSDISFVSVSDSGSADIKVDFVGLNTLVVDEILSASNLLSSSDYFNDSIQSLDDALLTNALLLHRQGAYGGSNWKLYRKSDHPIVRAHRKENRISFLQTSLERSPGGQTVSNTVIQSKIEPPIVNKFRSIEFDTVISDPKTGEEQDLRFQQTYLNDFSKFSNKIPGEDDFDINEGEYFRSVQKYSKKDSTYFSVRKIVNRQVSDEINPISLTNAVKTREVFWPKQQYTYLSDHRQREDYANSFWRRDELDRREGNSGLDAAWTRYAIQDAYDFISYSSTLVGIYYNTPAPLTDNAFTGSIWSLDARQDFDTRSPGRIKSGSDEGLTTFASTLVFRSVVSGGQGGTGILQNNFYPYANYCFVSSSTGGAPQDWQLWYSPLFPQYNRRIAGVIPSDTDHEYKFGDTKWEAGSQSGLAPFYDTYDEYVEDIKRVGKDYSVIPEYRISEHIDYYLNNSKDFLVKPPGAYEVTGALVSSSADSDFEKIYLHSDFLNTFNIVNSDFDTLENTKITLSADALIKFLPYNGFYPAERTVQLTKLFWESYSASFAITGSDITSYSEVDLGEPIKTRLSGLINPVWKPLFAPGILYNSIKSGLAVDYPVHTSDVSLTGSPNQRNGLGYLTDIPRIASDFDHRISFEALADPLGTIGGLNIVDNEPHPSASISLTASLGGSGKLNYVLAMNNFLASTIDFFKEDGKLTTLASLSDEDPEFGIGFEAGKEYKMRIACYNGIYNSLQAIDNYLSDPTGAAFASASFNNTSPSIINYAQTGSDPDPRSDYYGSAFGPPVESSSSLMESYSADRNYSSASYEPFTPPYYDGYSHIELTYRPEFPDENLHAIISQLTQSFYRLSTALSETGVSGDNRMHLSASLNYLQVVQQPSVKYDVNGRVLEIDNANAGNVLTVQPKWECPILNFKNVDVTLPEIGSGSVARGMWHQYGQLPAEGEGVYLQVQDLAPSELNNPSLTGSLADKLGFRKEPVRIGEIARQKKISEAIVAIPFKQTYPDGIIKDFYKINKQTIKAAIAEAQNRPTNVPANLAPSEEIVDMVRKMKKFVIPPHLDFASNDTIDPFAMFIFDFEVTLKQNDLANIWQNLSPEIGTKAIKSNASLPVELFAPNKERGSSLMPMFDKDTRWMVFKVKQRASYNYFAKTADSSDDERFKFNFEFGSRNAEKTSTPDYSYNWPFDFFSLIELGKLSAEHEFKNKDKGGKE